MATVQTVTGPLESARLGVTLMHEHVITAPAGWQADGFAVATRTTRDAVVATLPKLAAMREAGVSTFVDVTPADLGRNVELLVEVSRASGVPIVCATGSYARWGLPYFTQQRHEWRAEDLAGIYIRDVTEGIGDSGVRAGVIKIATNPPPHSPYEQAALRGAAIAQRETGVPIVTHCERGLGGHEQLDLFEQERANLRQCVIGHTCDSSDLAYLRALLARGATLGFDRMGLDRLYPDALRQAMLVALLQLGYADQIVLSHDHIPYRFVRAEHQLSLGDGDFTYIHRQVLPRLREAGIGQDVIERMLVATPRRLFEG